MMIRVGGGGSLVWLTDMALTPPAHERPEAITLRLPAFR